MILGILSLKWEQGGTVRGSNYKSRLRLFLMTVKLIKDKKRRMVNVSVVVRSICFDSSEAAAEGHVTGSILHILLVTLQPCPLPIKKLLPFHASKFENRNFTAERLKVILYHQLFQSRQEAQSRCWLKGSPEVSWLPTPVTGRNLRHT